MFRRDPSIFHDAVTFWRMFFLSLVFVGIVGLKMVH